MNVLKFGGGVLKSATEIKMMCNILKRYENTVVVVSAIGKTTNLLEDLLIDYFKNNKKLNMEKLDFIKSFHFNICDDLFENKNSEIYNILNDLFINIKTIFESGMTDDFNLEYDKIISQGEILSSYINYHYLKSQNLKIRFIDIRQFIKTDSTFREAKINWTETEKNLVENCLFDDNNLCITQGFIASDSFGNTTTLGREGSDFTASIIAFCLNAKKVEFWKEVEGIYNADPTKSTDYVLIPRLSYKEAVEQTYYGAKVLHPKTIKPLQNKKIDVEVRSFYLPEKRGTVILDIHEFSDDFYPDIPIYIVKENQILISFSTLDFSFVAEDNLSVIFNLLADYKIKVNLMQNSAISFSVCVDNSTEKIIPFMENMKQKFEIKYNDNLKLVTIRHYSDEAISKMTKNYKIILSQLSRHTARFVLK
jgi:aspartate kinase